MTRLVIPTLTSAKALAACAALGLLATPAVAQVQEETNVEDIARTPLEDFNIASDELPEALVKAAENPYAHDGLTTCNAIVAEIAALDTALGADFDIAIREEGGDGININEGRIAKSIVGSFIPFRSLIREVSGANDRRDAFRLAVTAGMIRRGYLKGLGQGRGCDYPARPHENAG